MVFPLDRCRRCLIWRSNYEPFGVQLLWRLGVRVPPPHFAPFWLIAVVHGTWFAVAWGVVMWLIFWPHQGASLSAMAVGAAVAGALSGLSIAACHAHARRK
ncbi:MAG: DUF6404 family protein [Metallibacterium scheffleri]|jgi:hypothetical protein|nr:DUF6404 family protein [Metallibacterium scheffleri]MCK9367170.1 DUF6404 family protein [Metallibacterium scheffleri]